MTLPATPSPKYRVVGDDWTFRAQFTQADGVTPLDLSGAMISADLFRAGWLAAVTTLTLDDGVAFVGPPSNGTIDLNVSSDVTSLFTGLDIDLATPASTTGNFSNRLVPTIIDSLGRRHSYGPIPIVPLGPRSTRVIPLDDLSPVFLLVGEQGPAGPALTLTIGSVATLPPGSAATATITGTTQNPVLNLGLPPGLTWTEQTDALTVTATNTLSALTRAADGRKIELNVNGLVYDGASVSVAGTTVTWNADAAGMPLDPTDTVTATYTY